MGDMANHPTPMAAAANEVTLCAFMNLFFQMYTFFCYCLFYAFILEFLESPGKSSQQ